MITLGIKDIIDILIIALLLFYVYRMMKSSGTLSLFYGVLVFFALWVIASEIFDMRLTGTILDKFMSIGLIILVIIFQDQIKDASSSTSARRGILGFLSDGSGMRKPMRMSIPG